MPAASMTDLGLQDLSHSDLEKLRQEIIAEARLKFNGTYDDMPEELLSKLAVITSSLRRKNAGPPKAEKKAAKGPKATTDDLLI